MESGLKFKMGLYLKQNPCLLQLFKSKWDLIIILKHVSNNSLVDKSVVFSFKKNIRNECESSRANFIFTASGKKLLWSSNTCLLKNGNKLPSRAEN